MSKKVVGLVSGHGIVLEGGTREYCACPAWKTQSLASASVLNIVRDALRVARRSIAK